MKIVHISFLLLSLVVSVRVYAESAVSSVEFTPTHAPLNDAERISFFTHSSAIVTYKDRQKKIFPLSYQPLYRSADKIGNWQAGTIVDRNGKPVMRSAANVEGDIAQGPFFASSPDANSLLGMQKGNNTAWCYVDCTVNFSSMRENPIL